jgi:hypothetical protein
MLEIQKSQSYTFEWSFFDRNIQEIPVTGSISVYKPGGSTKLVDNASVAIETGGTMKYTLDSSLTTTVDKNYKIELSYQVGDVVTRPFYLFNIVETPLINSVRDEDLFLYVPELRDKANTTVIETTSTGSTITFISKELNYLNTDFKGGLCEIFIDNTTQHNAEIQDWDKATSTITFSPSYSTNIASGLKVSIRSSYQDIINESYNRHVYRDIRNRVPLASGFIDSTVTDNMTIFKTLEIISMGRVEETDDKWDIRRKEFADMYGKEYGKLNEAYDYDEDGTIDPSEQDNKPSFINRTLTR